jgi:hypothetical protein
MASAISVVMYKTVRYPQLITPQHSTERLSGVSPLHTLLDRGKVRYTIH